jgi:hypothetical protein
MLEAIKASEKKNSDKKKGCGKYSEWYYYQEK